MQSVLNKSDFEEEDKNLCGINRIRAIQFQSWISTDLNYKRFFDPRFNLTIPFIKDIQYRAIGENHFIIEFLGETGTGKSIAAILIFLKVLGYKTFTVDHVCFERKELIQKVKDNFDKNSGYLLDEQTVGVGIGSDRELLEQQNLEEITRKAGLNIGFCSPTERTHGTAHYRLLYIKKDKKKRISFFGILRNMGNMRYIPIGYIVIKIPEETGEFGRFWREYNINKDRFIQKMLKQKELQRLNYKEMAQSILNHSHFRRGLKFAAYMYITTELFPTKTVQELKNSVQAMYLYFPKEIRAEIKSKVEQKEKKKVLMCLECEGKSISYNKQENRKYCRRCGSENIEFRYI